MKKQKSKLIRACLVVQNPQGLQRIINSDGDSAVIVDLQETVSLDRFKRHLLN